MDALTAVSLAASIAQFVDFIGKLISKTNEIRKEGSTVDVEYLKARTSELLSLNAGLRKRTRGNASRSSEIAQIEQAIDNVVAGCTAIGDDLVGCLDKLISSRPGVWKSVQQAILTVWHKEKIDELCKKLDGYRQQFAVQLLMLLNAKAEKQSADNTEKFRNLEQDNKKIIEIVTFTQSILKAALPEQISELERRVLQNQRFEPGQGEGQNEIRGQQRNERAISAILTLEDGTAQVITYPVDQAIDPGAQGRSQYIETATTFRYDLNSSQTGEVSIEKYPSLQRNILDALYFENVHQRQVNVAEAHRDTFEWIFFEEDAFEGFGLSHWLKAGSGCYWVNGKAGSGKSTLMKFIHRHSKTRQALQTWADGGQLVVPSFFFWNAGTTLQKSQEGLLRSLLLAVLAQHPHLIPAIFPELCRTFLANKSAYEISISMTFTEIKKAFRTLLDANTSSLKICMFVDGVDEYGGDIGEMCDLLINVTLSHNVKAVISSRPLNICQVAFSQYSNIRLQDLTGSDIRRYVNDKLTKDPIGYRLMVGRPVEAEDLVNQVTDKAYGVFLWVILVVRSLLYGLLNRDALSDLQRRLDELPTDLAALYRHMFRSMDPVYRQHASKIFQVVVRSSEMQAYGPMSVVQLTYAEEGTLTSAIRAPRKLMLADERSSRVERTERRLRSICCGLLEINRDTSTSDFSGSSSIDASVGFLHMTVVEFLRNGDVWDELQSYIPKGSFDSNVSLLGSCLQEAKGLPIERAMILDTDRIMIDMRHCFIYARFLELARGRPYTAVLDQLNETMMDHWNEAEKFKERASDDKWSLTEGLHWSESTARFLYPSLGRSLKTDPFLALATYSGCVLFVADKTLGNKSVTNEERTALLGQMLVQFFNTSSEGHTAYRTAFTENFNYITAIGKLLKQGARPHSIIHFPPLVKRNKTSDTEHHEDPDPIKSSPWRYYLTHVLISCDKSTVDILDDDPANTISRAIQLLEIFQSFIIAGAKFNASILWEEDGASSNLSAATILQRLHAAVCDPGQRTFKVALQEDDLSKFRSKYEETLKLVEAQKTNALNRLILEATKAISRVAVTPIGQSFLSFALGGLLVLILAQWLQSPSLSLRSTL